MTKDEQQKMYKLALLDSPIQLVLERNDDEEHGCLCGSLVEVIGGICSCCKKKVDGEMYVSSFGGMYSPTYGFTCIACRQRGQEAYEASCRDVDIHQSMLDDY